ncbi:MAG: hypothetical protein ABGX16_15115 [Pirellulales bacterium]
MIVTRLIAITLCPATHSAENSVLKVGVGKSDITPKLSEENPVWLAGLANDAIGYIVPKRQWDTRAPFAYEQTSPQYGEINSTGPDTGKVLMDALADRVRESMQD